MSKLVMGYWDCPICGNKEIRGDVTNCPACGRARGDVKFYVKGYTEGQSLQKEELSQFEELDDQKAAEMGENPDWYCSFCNSLNSDKAQVCSNCGATRADSEANYFDRLKKKEEQAAAEQAARPQAPAKAQKKSRSPLVIFAVLLLALIAVFVWMNGSKTAGDLKVTALQWTRVINIEENRKYSESDWSLPAGAQQTGTRREIHHYDSVLDHYETVEVQRSRSVYDHDEYTMVDNGNGTFREVSHPVYRTEYYTDTEQRPVYRQEPRYATKYYYDIWRWTPSRDVVASGEDHNPEWPVPDPGANEREGKHSEEYRFTVEHTEKTNEPAATYRLAESDWMNINVGDHLYITSRRTGADPYISDEKGNRIADIEKVR